MPLRRLGTPEEVVQAVMFLLSEEWEGQGANEPGSNFNISGIRVGIEASFR